MTILVYVTPNALGSKFFHLSVTISWLSRDVRKIPGGRGRTSFNTQGGFFFGVKRIPLMFESYNLEDTWDVWS